MAVEISPKLRHRIGVLKHIFPEAYQEVDGYYVAVLNGAYTPADLKVVAELLDEANRKWDEEVIRDLGALSLQEKVIRHLFWAHNATLHPPGKPNGKAIGGTDEDAHLLHSIYFPNCLEF